jgi:hypothetical protein
VFLRDGQIAGEVEGGSASRVFEFLRALEQGEEAPQGAPGPAPLSAR